MCHGLCRQEIVLSELEGGHIMQQEKMGCLLRSLRKEKGMTQEQMAEIFGVTNRTVSRWENGKNMPDVSILVELSKYFGVSILELIEGERKQDKMMTDNKEELKTLVNYADEHKRIILKSIHRFDLLGFLLCAIAAVSMCIYYESGQSAWLLMQLISLGIMAGIFASKIFAASGFEGIIKESKQKHRVLKYLEIVLSIVILVVLCRDAYFILTGNF